jgi:hypothetical protein
MMNQLTFALLVALSLYGCGYESKTDSTSLLESVADTKFFNDQELMTLKNSVQLISDTYRESGVDGMRDYIDLCYDSPSVDPLVCIGADYAAHMIDANISSYNNFPLEEYFYENNVIARIISTKDFNGENIFVLFSAVAAVKQRVIILINEINPDYEVNFRSDGMAI